MSCQTRPGLPNRTIGDCRRVTTPMSARSRQRPSHLGAEALLREALTRFLDIRTRGRVREFVARRQGHRCSSRCGVLNPRLAEGWPRCCPTSQTGLNWSTPPKQRSTSPSSMSPTWPTAGAATWPAWFGPERHVVVLEPLDRPRSHRDRSGHGCGGHGPAQRRHSRPSLCHHYAVRHRQTLLDADLQGAN